MVQSLWNVMKKGLVDKGLQFVDAVIHKSDKSDSLNSSSLLLSLRVLIITISD